MTTTDLHAVYRVENEGTADEFWSTYSFPEGVYTSGNTLQRARLAFHQLMRYSFEEELDEINLIEHVERPVYDDVFVRVAFDQHQLDRDETARVFAGSLTVGSDAAAHRAEVDSTMPTTVSGDRVVVACVARDTIEWALNQTGSKDSIGVCLLGPAMPGRGAFVAWIYLIREAVQDLSTSAPTESLADAGLEVQSTIADLLTTAPSERSAAVLIRSA